MNYVSELTTCGNMVYHFKLSRFDHTWFCQIHCQAKFYFLLLDSFFKSILCLFVMVILKVLNWGVYIGHEIFVMMKPGFLSNLNQGRSQDFSRGTHNFLNPLHLNFFFTCHDAMIKFSLSSGTVRSCCKCNHDMKWKLHR